MQFREILLTLKHDAGQASSQTRYRECSELSGEGGEHLLRHVIGPVVIGLVAVLPVLTSVAPMLPLLPCLVRAAPLSGVVGAALGSVEQPAPVVGCAADLALLAMEGEGGDPLQGLHHFPVKEVIVL